MERNRMGEIAITAGLGFAAGALLANPARKLAMQGAEAIGTRDWVDALTLEHRAVSKIFDALLQTSEEQTGKRRSGLAAIDHALTKHSLQEIGDARGPSDGVEEEGLGLRERARPASAALAGGLFAPA